MNSKLIGLTFEKCFKYYSKLQAPFMHMQLEEWKGSKPLQGLRVLHHVPLVRNTLLKIACLVAGGADVTVTNPSFMMATKEAIDALKYHHIPYVKDFRQLKDKKFDIYLDTNAESFKALGPPSLGAVELTASDDEIYRKCTTSFPTISTDEILTKQLEAFASSLSTPQAISRLTGLSNLKNKTWLIFGFGKIGRGIAYYCVKNNVKSTIVDPDLTAIQKGKKLGVNIISPKDKETLHSLITHADIIITATGKKGLLDDYPKDLFSGKILANMGVVDEYGYQFSQEEVLNNKLPVNFILEDPTPTTFIDPTFYAHNIAILELLNYELSNQMYNLSQEKDQYIIKQWCTFHSRSLKEIEPWFTPREDAITPSSSSQRTIYRPG